MFCPFHGNLGFTLTLLPKDPQNSNSEEGSENRETFSVSKFSPAIGVTQIIALSLFPPKKWLVQIHC